MEYGILSKILDFFKSRSVGDVKHVIDIYRTALEDARKEHDLTVKKMREQIEQQLKIIDSYKAANPGNGKELDEWRQREEELYSQLAAQAVEIMELKSQVMFWEKMKK